MRQKHQFLLGIFACLAYAGTARAASEVRIQPALPTPETVGSIGSSGSWGLSLGVQSITPLSSPFKTIDGTSSYKFRFQTSTGFGIELSHKLTDEFEVGVATAYVTYEARGSLNNSDSADQQFETARVRQVPVEVIGRYRSSVSGWAPEFEAGVGMGFGSVRITSTNLSFGPFSESISFLKGHLAGGFGYPWSDDVSFHLRAGYGIEALGSKTYDSNTIQVQRSAISGIFLRGDMRIAF